MKNVAIIQARMGSRRFPGKVLADLAGEPLLARVVERTRLSRRLDQVLVATSQSSSDDPIANLCRRRGWGVFRGDEHDVLGRYASAAQFARADRIVRITSDCPLVDGRLIDQALDQFDETKELDYLSMVVDRAVLPAGFDVEVLAAKCLQHLNREVRRTWWREHVTLYIRQYPDQFKTQLLRLEDEPADSSDWELSVDTPGDLERVRAIFQRRASSNFSWSEALQTARELACPLGPAVNRKKQPPTGRTDDLQLRTTNDSWPRAVGPAGTSVRSGRDARCECRKTVRRLMSKVLESCPNGSLLGLGPRVGDAWWLHNRVGQDFPMSELLRDFDREATSEVGLSDGGHGAGGEWPPTRPTLLTVNRLGSSPTAEPFLEWLRGWPILPAKVIQFESCWIPRRSGPDGARRNRWIVRRDGCRDLVMLLQSAADIVLEQSELDCVTSGSGRSFHLLVWHFIDVQEGNRYTEQSLGFNS